MNNSDDAKLKYGITLAAVIIAIIHIVWPNLKIDVITLALLFIALIPWLSPLFKSLKIPGGWEIEFQEMRTNVDAIVAKETEPADLEPKRRSGVRAISINDDITRSVLQALGDSRYTWRSLDGLLKTTKLPLKNVLNAISWLLDAKLATESKLRQEQWALSQEGRDILNTILQSEHKSNN